MYAIEINQLRKTYQNGIEALKGIDLSIEKGDFFALLGANGAGKSTTIGTITTLLTKTSGTIRINGSDLDTSPSLAKASLGLVPQEVNLNVFETCEQILLNQAGFYGISSATAKARAHTLLYQLSLWDKRHTIARHLSGGMKRRLMIARALIHQPQVLILDEPTAGVDVEIRKSMWHFLKETNAAGTTIILTTHYLEEAEQLCKNIAIINQGHIIKHTSMEELLRTLHYQTLIFTTEKPLTTLPDVSPYQALLVDASTFELRIDKKTALNDIFALLSQQDIRIHSLRNKTNRLEALFLELIGHG